MSPCWRRRPTPLSSSRSRSRAPFRIGWPATYPCSATSARREGSGASARHSSPRAARRPPAAPSPARPEHCPHGTLLVAVRVDARGSIAPVLMSAFRNVDWPGERLEIGRIAARRLCTERMAGSGASCRSKPNSRPTDFGRERTGGGRAGGGGARWLRMSGHTTSARNLLNKNCGKVRSSPACKALQVAKISILYVFYLNV